MMTRFGLLTLVLSGALFALPAHADSAERASRYYEDALVRMERNDTKGSILQLKNALQQDPRMVSAHLLIGRAYLKAGQPDAAERSLQDAERLGVDRSETAVLMAEALFDQAKFRAVLDRGMTDGLATADRIRLLTLRGRSYMELGEYEAANKTLLEAEATVPGTLAVIVARATLALNQGQLVAARQLAEQAVAKGPNDADAWNILASVHHVQGNTQQALGGYARVLKINPKILDARIGRVSLNLDVGNDKAVGADLAYIQKNKFVDPRASYLLAMWFARQGNDKAARDYLFATQRQVEMVPTEMLKRRSQLLMLGGLANHGLNQPEKAKAYLFDYIKLHPKQLGARKLLASIYLTAREPAKAVEILLPVKDQLPSDPDALAMMANAYMALNRHATAAELLEEAMLQPNVKPLVQSTLGFSLLATGRETLGVQQLQQAFADDPGQTRAGMTLVTYYLKTNQNRQARETAERLVKQSPNNLALLNLMGVARALTGDYKGARQAYDRALALDKKFSTARLNLGRLERAEGRPQAARAQFAEVLRLNPGSTQAMAELAGLDEAAGKFADAVRWLEKAQGVRPNDVTIGLQLLELYLRNGNPEQALNVAKNLRGAAPDNMDVVAAYGRTQLALGQTEAARKTFQGMTRRAGFDVNLLTRIARLQISAGDRVGAEYTLQKAVLQQDNYMPAQALLAELEIASGNTASAEARIQRLLGSPATQATGQRLQADLYMRQRRYDQAVTAYRAALASADSLDNALGLYRAWQATGKPQEAARHMETWSRAHPAEPAARRVLAEAYLAAGRLPEARRAYEQILATRPNDPVALNNLANILLQTGDAGALAMAERAYRAAPQDADAADTLGLVLLRSNQAERALKYLREARLRAPKNPAIRDHLAEALEASGRADAAREERAAAQSLRARR